MTISRAMNVSHQLSVDMSPYFGQDSNVEVTCLRVDTEGCETFSLVIVYY